MRIILDTDNEQNFVDLWNPEKNNWERYIKCEEKEETKPITKESIEVLGYACGEIQKCFTNGWEKSLKNKTLNEEDKKIKEIDVLQKILSKDKIEGLTNEVQDIEKKLNEIIKVINEMREDK